MDVCFRPGHFYYHGSRTGPGLDEWRRSYTLFTWLSRAPALRTSFTTRRPYGPLVTPRISSGHVSRKHRTPDTTRVHVYQSSRRPGHHLLSRPEVRRGTSRSLLSTIGTSSSPLLRLEVRCGTSISPLLRLEVRRGSTSRVPG
ncbi:hypothetical protein BRADI_1g15986v3 [Brachypodium distachyon]|uniref:Uncharacterized protein n=1 Tax=Brachypodium distachyon TaxID=15368 RepID=A0A2K2DJQ2_BRADI|nr:hypothetical protein BRADI_1g15986v3 [Brachypodium distachyon]